MILHRLADCWVPVFDAARRGFADPANTYETLAPALIAVLDAADMRARGQQFTDTQVREALFAVVAWIDETAMSSDWCGANQWRRAPLQRHYFSTSRAGVEFFQRLDALPEASQGVREVFGLALLSGFEGQFATRPGVELTQYRRLCLEQIIVDNNITPLDAFSTLFNQPQNRLAQRLPLVRRGLPGLVLALLVGTPLLILGGLYLSFDLQLTHQTRQLQEVR